MDHFIRWGRVLCLLIAVGLLYAAHGRLPSTNAGAPLYPDLRTSPPRGMYFETSSSGRVLLRFDNTVANHGGRLEITANIGGNSRIYQNVYDKKTGGNQVIHKHVASDLIYHPAHNHFHFADFARYELLKANSYGVYRVTERQGIKTSFCILDYVRVLASGASSPQYSTCGSTVQGLSAGWGDTYFAYLPEQYIDVGTRMLADGRYALRSIADPYNRLLESNDDNNEGITYFTISNGRISTTGTPPTCSVNPVSGRVGTSVTFSCTGFAANETVDVYWGSTSSTPKTNTKASSSGKISTSITVPPSSLGLHYIIARGRTSNKQVGAAFNTTASVTLEKSRGTVGTKVNLTVRGFSAGETVAVNFRISSSTVALVTKLTVSSAGTASGQITIPQGANGPHQVEAIGKSSGARATSTFSVDASLAIQPSTIAAGSSGNAILFGFGSGETVTVSLQQDGTVIGTGRVSLWGSSKTHPIVIEFPADLTAGRYQVIATGNKSNAKAGSRVTITNAVTTAEERPRVRPSPTIVETSATNVPEITATPSDVATVSPTVEPAATEMPTPTEQPTEIPTPTASATDSPTLTPSPTEAAPQPTATTSDQDNETGT